MNTSYNITIWWYCIAVQYSPSDILDHYMIMMPYCTVMVNGYARNKILMNIQWVCGYHGCCE